MNALALNGRQARWATELAPYDFNIVYRSGKTNPADGPSRRPDYDTKDSPDMSMLPILQSKIDSRDTIAYIRMLPTLMNKLSVLFMRGYGQQPNRGRVGPISKKFFQLSPIPEGLRNPSGNPKTPQEKPTVLTSQCNLCYLIPRILAVEAIVNEDPFEPECYGNCYVITT